MAGTTNNAVAKKSSSQPRFSVTIQEEKYQKMINDTLGDKEVARTFIAEITSVVANNNNIAKCTTPSILGAALLAQSLKLPLTQSLGFAYSVPYQSTNKDGQVFNVCQFQIGWKGLVQLCQRTNLFANIGVRPVHEGEWVGQDEFGEDVFKFDHKHDANKAIGYFAYFKLLSGFKKTLYWTVAQCEAHGIKYSQAHRGKNKGSDYDNWTKMFEQMAEKTVLKQLLSKYAPMSVEISRAVESDQAVIEDGTVTYVDKDKDTDVVSTQDIKDEVTLPDDDLPFETDSKPTQEPRDVEELMK